MHLGSIPKGTSGFLQLCSLCWLPVFPICLIACQKSLASCLSMESTVIKMFQKRGWQKIWQTCRPAVHLLISLNLISQPASWLYFSILGLTRLSCIPHWKALA